MSRRPYQLPPEIPTTEIGSHVRPTGTSTSWTTTPRRDKIPAAAGSEALVTELQHCRSPVEQELAGVEEGCGATETVEVATARRGAARRAMTLENIVVIVERFSCEKLLSSR